MQQTLTEYDEVIEECRSLFKKKGLDYGSAWRILRLPSLTDQIFIKAQRIRSLQEKTERKVDEGQRPEFIGIINYAAMALVQLEKGVVDQPDLNAKEALKLYDKQVAIAKNVDICVDFHTPFQPEVKREYTQMMLDICRECGLPMSNVIIDHCTDDNLGVALEAGANAAISVQPWRGITGETAADPGKQ